LFPIVELKYVIIDEMSMIGCKMLGMVNRRLKQGNPELQHLPFGGLNLILMGDHAQLPPLFDLPLYCTPGANAYPLTIDGSSLYHSFDKAVILSRCYRQAGTTSDEVNFRDILMRLRDGNNTEEDWRFLLRRSRHNLCDEEVRVFDESIHLFTTNEECNKYNM
jgi:ATP-dependent DNA helicase PIF1